MKQHKCNICNYECSLLMLQNAREPLVDHRFNCSIANVKTLMRIPVLRPITANNVRVMMYVDTIDGKRLAAGEAQLHPGNLKYSPNSSAFRVTYMDQYAIEFNVSVVCIEGFAGPQCNISCPTPKANDHYECAQQGKVCLKGWMGENCSTPVCTNGCRFGECVAPNQCHCLSGWKGARCSECVKKTGCQNGYCMDRPGQCKCYPGFTGTFCETQTFRQCSGPSCDHSDSTTSNPSNQLTNETSAAQFQTSAVILLIACLILVLLVIVLLFRSFCSSRSTICRANDEKISPI
ncbi:hypothetical protein M3Y94_00201200 [Aphelenchoides besseyi]|nr:hypothetical protein M3Y94_00201200 [Aphelenchoides besseyi]